MSKKNIQEERMKKYFIDAAKEIIRGEGIEAVSARNIAERAGYSYATLYNYFDNINDLIFSCIEFFIDECRENIANNFNKKFNGKKYIEAVTIEYVNYFIQYPGIFNLLYQQKLTGITSQKVKVKKIQEFFIELIKDEWSFLTTKDEKKLTIPMYKYMLNGLLMEFFNQRNLLSYNELILEVKNINKFFFE